MTESPGKVLSSFASSNEKKRNNSRLGGCAGVFLQLLDRFHGKKLLPHNLLPSERPKHNTISHREEKLPMAKLLLIADEKRIAASKEDKETLSVTDGFCQRNEDEEGHRRASVSVVARLMGLETMPSPKLSADSKQAVVLKGSSEAQSTIKLLQCKKVPVKRAQRNTKAMDIRIQTLKRTTKSSHTDLSQRLTGSSSVDDILKHPSVRSKLNLKSSSCESLTQMNLRKGEDPRAFIFSKLPLPTIQMESQLRSILSPSRTSSKLPSPNKSPLSSKSAARLFEAAARVLEPNFRSARHPRFSSHNDKSAPYGNADEETKKKSSTLSESKRFAPSNVPSVESQATSKCSNSSPEKSKRLSPNCGIQNRPVHSKHGARKTVLHVKNEKWSSKMLARKKPSLLSDTSKLEAKDPTNGECRLITSSTWSKTSANCAPIDNEGGNVHAPLMEEGSKQEGSSAMQGLLSLSPPGTRSAKRSNHGKTFKPSRTERAPQRLFSTSHTPGKNMIQEGSRNNVKARFVTDGKATSLSKPTSTNAHGRTNVEDLKRQSSCSRSSLKRKASSLSPKPNIMSNVARTDAVNFKLQNVEHERNLRKLANERQSNSPQSEFDAPTVCCSDVCDTGSSIMAESRGQTRVRARWDIADERKKTLTMSCISCSNSNGQLSSCSSVIGSTLKGKDALKIDEVAAGPLQGQLLSLDASTSRSLSPELGTPEYKPLCFSNGSEALYDCNSRCVKGLTGLLNECSSNIDCYLGGAKQRLRNYDRISVQEDSSAQDSESISGSFCAEECEQPSPISILESPFHDSASCSSDTFEAPQGIKLWEAMENKVVDDVSTIADHMEDANSHGIQIDKKSFTTRTSLFHCTDFGSLENGAIREDEDSYVKKILGTLLPSAESAVWERVFSGPLIDPLICFQLEENHHLLTLRARMPTGPCSKEIEQERQLPTTYTSTWFKEAAPQQKKLLFDCIEVALKLSLELAMWSYGFLVPCMQIPPAYLEEAVHRHLGEWKGLAFSMNLDDMMKVEINAGMERWFKYGDEVDSVAMNVEAMILDGLVDELMKDVLQKARACCLCT